tara:strand:- start:482 stop:727 length:246 start_codon:yes stop_codon:yes gene_type:complete
MEELNGDLAPGVTVYLIYLDLVSRAFMKENALTTLNGLSNEEFIRMSKQFGDAYDITEFEMFWNTGEIPAFCNLRFIKTII